MGGTVKKKKLLRQHGDKKKNALVGDFFFFFLERNASHIRDQCLLQHYLYYIKYMSASIKTIGVPSCRTSGSIKSSNRFRLTCIFFFFFVRNIHEFNINF